MHTIILTKDIADGQRLKAELSRQRPDLGGVECFTYDGLKNAGTDVRHIFSTWYMPALTPQDLDMYLPELEAVFYAAGTVEYFAQPLLEKGIKVFSAASANGIPVAEMTAAQVVMANKGYFQAQCAYHWPIWTRGFRRARGYAERKCGNFGAKIGIIGCGAVGSKVVELLRPYKLEVWVYDPYVSDEKIAELGAKKGQLEHIFAQCDVISNHLPDIPQTRGLIDYHLLSLMKPTATIINTGRGRQIVESDLNRILRERKDMCALLDVTTHEPLFPWSPLYWRRNAFITPHIAGSLSNEFGRMVEYMLSAYDDVLAGRTNKYEIMCSLINSQA